MSARREEALDEAQALLREAAALLSEGCYPDYQVAEARRKLLVAIGDGPTFVDYNVDVRVEGVAHTVLAGVVREGEEYVQTLPILDGITTLRMRVVRR